MIVIESARRYQKCLCCDLRYQRPNDLHVLAGILQIARLLACVKETGNEKRVAWRYFLCLMKKKRLKKAAEEKGLRFPWKRLVTQKPELTFVVKVLQKIASLIKL